MGKAAENEKARLRATFWNSVATGFALTGIVTPWLAYSFKSNKEATVWKVLTGQTSWPEAEPILIMVFVMLYSFGLSAGCRLCADESLDNYRD